MRENSNSFQYYHNNREYCQYGEKCQYQHYKEECPKRLCKDKECKFRHPRICNHKDHCKFLRKRTTKFEQYENEVKHLTG